MMGGIHARSVATLWLPDQSGELLVHLRMVRPLLLSTVLVLSLLLMPWHIPRPALLTPTSFPTVKPFNAVTCPTLDRCVVVGGGGQIWDIVHRLPGTTDMFDVGRTADL
jgi:hypothetical protein